MTNVKYPFLDLTEALLQLLGDLKPPDWEKTTLLNEKAIALANNLLKNHFSNSSRIVSFKDEGGNIDRSVLIREVETHTKNLKANLSFPEVNGEKYCYCWLLQQHIRQPVNNQDLLSGAFYHPYLITVMQRLANHYQAVNAENGTLLKFEIVGEAGGIWLLEKIGEGWKSVKANSHQPAVTVYLDQQIAWLLFSGLLHLSEIGQFYQIIGNKTLGIHFLSLSVSFNTTV